MTASKGDVGGADLRHIEDWVFDLDNTLYDASFDLFAQIDSRMADYVQQLLQVDLPEAKRLQKLYYADHGTTLAGLMRLHSVDPHDYLEYVHDIDLSALQPDRDLSAALKRLPGRRFVFTNGSRGHAERVVRQLGIEDAFNDLFDIAAADFIPKPSPHSFHALTSRYGINTAKATLFEDLERNLKTAHELGFTTILVTSDKDWSHEPEGVRPANHDARPDCAHFVTANLTAFLHKAVFRD